MRRNASATSHWRTAAVAIAVSLLLALCFPFIERGLSASSPLMFAGWRAACGGGILLVLALLSGRPFPQHRADWAKLLGVSICATSIGYGAMFAGGGLIRPGLATVIANVQPLIAAVLAITLLREHCGLPRALSLLLGFIGVVLLAGLESGRIPELGAGLLLLSAFALAIGNLLLKSLAARTDPVTISGLQLSLGAPILFAAASLTGESFVLPNSTDFWLSLLILAGASTAMASVLWQWVLSRAPLNQVNAVSFLVPVYGLPLMWQEGSAIGWSQWLGAGLVVIGVAFILRQPVSAL